MRVLAEIGVGGVDGQRCVTLVRLVSHTEPELCHLCLPFKTAGLQLGMFFWAKVNI